MKAWNWVKVLIGFSADSAVTQNRWRERTKDEN